jgi:hypothetical protein
MLITGANRRALVEAQVAAAEARKQDLLLSALPDRAKALNQELER